MKTLVELFRWISSIISDLRVMKEMKNARESSKELDKAKKEFTDAVYSGSIDDLLDAAANVGNKSNK